jgi:hypothetical protein
LRVVLPNANFGPRSGTTSSIAISTSSRYATVDLDIMVNEHHSTATCLTVSVPMALAIIARGPTVAAAVLGTPIANRRTRCAWQPGVA